MLLLIWFDCQNLFVWITRKIKAKRKGATSAGGFNFAVPPSAASTITSEAPKLNWSFGIPASSALTTTPSQKDKDTIIKELEKRVEELTKETEQLKKELQATKQPSSGGFAFSFSQPSKPVQQPSVPPSQPKPTIEPVKETPKPVVEPVKETPKPVEEKPKTAAAPLFNFNFGSTPSATTTSDNKLSFGGFSTFSNPFSGSSIASGESQFKFEISNKPPTWTNSDYKPKENDDEDGGEDATVEESPSKATSHKLIDLPPADLKSGEEGEKVIAEYKQAKLFRSVTTSEGKASWQQRGIGCLKLNTAKDNEKDCRLVMRTDSVFKLILNAKLFHGMKVTPFQEQSIIFSVHKSQLCEQLSAEELAKESEFVSHLVRFDQKNDRNDFKQKIEALISKI